MISGLIQGKEEKDGFNEETHRTWKRWTFTIGDKKYSTFDENIAKAFNIGDTVKVEGGIKGKFFNMTGMKKIDIPVEKPGQHEIRAINPNGPIRGLPYPDKTASMYTSYAKDIFVALVSRFPEGERDVRKLMESAILLVKQAKEAFE